MNIRSRGVAALAVLACVAAFSAPATAMNPCQMNPDSANCPPPNWGQNGNQQQSGNQQNNTNGGGQSQMQTSTSTASLSTLQAEVSALQSQVAQLQSQVQALQGQRGSLQQATPSQSATSTPATMPWGPAANPPPH